MTEDDVIDLLSVIVHYDNRNADTDEVIRAFSKASEVGRWTRDEAIEAVHQHYAVDTAWLMPGHITAHIRSTRQDAAMRKAASDATRAISGDGHRVVQLAQRVADAKAIEPSGDVAPRRSPRSVKCEFCGALPGNQCTRPSRNGPTVVPDHPSRVDAVSTNAATAGR